MLPPIAQLAGMSKYLKTAIAFGLVLSACGGQIVSETFEHVGTRNRTVQGGAGASCIALGWRRG